MMKKLIKTIKVLAVIGIMALNINPLYACLPHLECDGDDGGLGAGQQIVTTPIADGVLHQLWNVVYAR